MRKLFFDIETSNIFSEARSNDPAALDLAVVGTFDSGTGEFKAFFQENLSELWPLIESVDMIVGYNSEHFDIPLLNKYYPGDLREIKSLDILKEIKDSYGRRMKLDQVAEGTFGRNKTGVGTDATVWWKRGERQKVVDYCLKDVELTRDIYEYALKNSLLKFKEGGEIIDIPLKTDHWEKTNDSAVTHTLPF